MGAFGGSGRREESEGQRVESAGVKSEEKVDEQSEEDIASPDLSEAGSFVWSRTHSCTHGTRWS